MELHLSYQLDASMLCISSFFFSIREVKKTFEKHHEKNADNMQEVKDKINKILELIKDKK